MHTHLQRLSMLMLQMIRTGYYGNKKPDSLLAGGAVTQEQMTPPLSTTRLGSGGKAQCWHKNQSCVQTLNSGYVVEIIF